MDSGAESIDVLDVEREFSNLTDGDDGLFDAYATAVIAHQKSFNPVYRKFDGFQFLPIEAFKRSPVCTFPHEEAEAVFKSSGTASTERRSYHYIRRVEIYRRSVLAHFRRVFGSAPFRIIGVIPTSHETEAHSSLFAMMQILIDEQGSPGSAIVDPSRAALREALNRRDQTNSPLLLFGLSFALLDILDEGSMPLPLNSIVIETGGMKTHRRKTSRSELHERLRAGFDLPNDRILSEYGMCELTSQFYMRPDGYFYPPSWVRFKIFNPNIPEDEMPDGTPGILAIFDMANLYSVSSILTQDSAIKRGKGFELLGRLTEAELRGCNFLLDSIT